MQAAVLRYAANGPIGSAVERHERLTSLWRDVDEDPFAVVKAIDVHNKMDGIYVTRVQLDPAQLVDENVPLKSFLPAA